MGLLLEVRAVAFDFDQTLVDLSSARAAGIQAMLGVMAAAGQAVDGDEFRRRFEALTVKDDATYLETGYYRPTQSRIEQICRESGLPANGLGQSLFGVYAKARYGALKPYPETLGALRALSGRRPMFMITNGAAAGQHRGIQASGLAPFFERVFVCDDYGLRKPQVEMFEMLRKAAGVEASQMLIVGDNPVADIDVPRRLGWKTAWVVRDDAQRAGADLTRADVVLRGVGDVPALLGL
jgi:HAD superfamily hydrolase (TIGR01509 family)